MGKGIVGVADGVVGLGCIWEGVIVGSSEGVEVGI